MGLPSTIISIVNKYDSSSVAFFNAAGITDGTQKRAVNELVVGLKTNNLWTKCNAIYPFVGGTATTHKFNLKNPADTNAAFRITWYGGVSHSNLGVIGNGTNGYGDTYLIQNTHIVGGVAHLSIYVNNNVVTGAAQIDAGAGSATNLYISSRYNTGIYNNFLGRNTSLSVLQDGGTNTDARGFYVTTKLGTTNILLKNGIQVDTKTDTAGNVITKNYILGFNENGIAKYFTNRTLSFSSIGSGLTNAESSTFYNIVQNFQTTLGRNV